MRWPKFFILLFSALLICPTLLSAQNEDGISLIYTGGSKGIGSGLYIPENSLKLMELTANDTLLSLEDLQSFHGTLAQGSYLFRAEDLSMSGAITLIGSGAIACGEAEVVYGVKSHFDTLILGTAGDPDFLEDLRGEKKQWHQKHCEGGGIRGVLTYPAILSGLPTWEIEAFEVRLAFQGALKSDGKSWPFTLTGRPLQERSRVFAILNAFQEQPNAPLYVDAGSFVDGASTSIDGAASLHRPLGYDMLEALAPTALAPGETELVLGAFTFMDEIRGRNLPYIATNWRSEDSDLHIPPYLIKEVDTPTGPVTLVFLAILDPKLLRAIPKLSQEGITIVSPSNAIKEALDAVNAKGITNYSVIALTTAGGDILESIRLKARGIDVLIGDPTLATFRVDTQKTNLRPLPKEMKGAPITLPMDGIARLDLTFSENKELGQINSVPIPVGAWLPQNPWVRGRITDVRAQLYPAMESPLLESPSGPAFSPLSQTQWEKLVCESVRRYTDADAVLLNNLPPPPRHPGILSDMMVADALVGLDSLELNRVQGSDMAWMLDRAFGVVDVSCGAQLGSRPRIQGRGVDDDRFYWVVTTEATRRSTALGGILASTHSKRLLDQPAVAVLQGTSDNSLSLQGAVVSALSDLRDSGLTPKESAQTVLKDAKIQRPPQWLFRVRALNLEIEGFQGMGTETFIEVPETLANSPSSLTLGTKTDIALEYDRADLYGDIRAKTTFRALRLDGGEIQETSDDWRISASMALPGVHLPKESKLTFMPYGEVLYDSEFTPLDEDDPNALKQSDLSTTMGISAHRVAFLRRLRFGLFANRSMAELKSKPTEYGATLKTETRHTPKGAATIRTYTDLQFYGKTSFDDPSDLRLRASGEVRLTLPLSTFLGASFYAQGLAIVGRVPETAQLGTAYTLGVSLDAFGAIDLARLHGPQFR